MYAYGKHCRVFAMLSGLEDVLELMVSFILDKFSYIVIHLELARSKSSVTPNIVNEAFVNGRQGAS